MPLNQSGSKKAVGENVSREMAAGKPQKQAVAIALNVQRRNRHDKGPGHSLRKAGGKRGTK